MSLLEIGRVSLPVRQPPQETAGSAGADALATLAFLAGLMLAASVALIGGAALTRLALDHGEWFGLRQAGAWTFWPEAGSTAADPYQRAITARFGALPMGLGEGVALFATTDDFGQPLSGACRYAIEGRAPGARFLSLAAYRPDGSGFTHKTGRRAFTGDELLRDQNGSWRVTASARAADGDWLPVDPGGPFVLVLRLYDTPLSANASAIAANAVPAVRKLSCR
jgi:hypothetical protein